MPLGTSCLTVTMNRPSQQLRLKRGSGPSSNEVWVTPPGKSPRSDEMRDKSEGESDWIVEDGEDEYEFGSSPLASLS